MKENLRKKGKRLESVVNEEEIRGKRKKST